jgi:hypothetical protein
VCSARSSFEHPHLITHTPQTGMELNCDTIDAHLRDTRGEKGRLEEQLGKVGERMQLLEEEVTQGRAHVDLYRIQMEESCEERNHLKVSVEGE